MLKNTGLIERWLEHMVNGEALSSHFTIFRLELKYPVFYDNNMIFYWFSDQLSIEGHYLFPERRNFNIWLDGAEHNHDVTIRDVPFWRIVV